MSRTQSPAKLRPHSALPHHFRRYVSHICHELSLPPHYALILRPLTILEGPAHVTSFVTCMYTCHELRCVPTNVTNSDSESHVCHELRCGVGYCQGLRCVSIHVTNSDVYPQISRTQIYSQYKTRTQK